MPVQKALRYMEEHLDDPLDLTSLAAALHYSKYHFLRQFTAAVGQPPGAYMQRRRLTEAAKQLAETDFPVLQIAISAGYESQQAFSTRFKAMYKQTPARFRRAGQFYPLQLPIELDMEPVPFGAPVFAESVDLPQWMALLRLTVDGFPCLDEDAHRRQLLEAIAERRALIVPGRSAALGAAVLSGRPGELAFFAIHPQYRGKGIERLLLKRLSELCRAPLCLTTFRARDCADPGHRAGLLSLGFREADCLTEFGYPTQRLVLPEGVIL